MRIRNAERKRSFEDLPAPEQNDLAISAGQRVQTIRMDVAFGLRALEAAVPGTAAHVAAKMAQLHAVNGIEAIQAPQPDAYIAPVIPINRNVVSRQEQTAYIAPIASVPHNDPRDMIATGQLAYALSKGGSVRSAQEAAVTTHAATGWNGGRDIDHASIVAESSYDQPEDNVRDLNAYVKVLEQPDYAPVDQQVATPENSYDQAARMSNAWAAVEQAQSDNPNPELKAA